MKKLLSVALLALAFTACKKDDEPTANGGLLDKIIQTEGGDSTISFYYFDVNKKLTGYKFIMKHAGSGTDSIVTNITRDASGRITQMVSVENTFTPITKTVVYNGTSAQIKYIKRSYSGGATGDSIHYVYSGNSIMEHHYYYGGGTTIPTHRQEYIFQNGNLVTLKDYDLTTGNVDGTTTFTYDSKKPALERSIEESLITEFFDFGFANNITGYVSVYPTDPSNNANVSVSYTYASTDQPLTAHAVGTPATDVKVKYYYK